MRQLPLELLAPAAPSFDNFVAGGNAEAMAAVRALAEGRLAERIVYLWGAQGSGRSHLLRAAANPALRVFDNVEQLDADEQQALFSAINGARDGEEAVLAAGAAPPAQLPLRDDVRTRLAWGLVYQLRPLSDEDKAEHLRNEAARRSLPLGEDVIAYLLRRLPRDFASLNSVLDLLDRESLSRQRPVTVPLARDVLSDNGDD
ncbi:MAG TPA: DnaA/Hda family protein [Burkholderiales bacterium]|nr:DnaA/Hda family protein [Burkholderiales bacterium]